MLDTTSREDVLFVASELADLYEYVKTIVIPIEESATLCNEAAINALEEQLKKVETQRDIVYSRIFRRGTMSASCGIFPVFNTITLGTLGLHMRDVSVEGQITKDVYNLAQILRVSKILFEKYKDQNIEIYPRLFLPDHGYIDIFVKFPAPHKKFALIALSSVGIGHRVYFSPEYNKLFDRTLKNRARKEYDCSKVENFKPQEIVLKKHHRHLLGSARESKKPIVKIFALCNPYKPPTESDTSRCHLHQFKFRMDFPEEMWMAVGSKKFPAIETQPIVLVVIEEMITGVIDCWLE
jgi:hypothetical protein